MFLRRRVGADLASLVVIKPCGVPGLEGSGYADGGRTSSAADRQGRRRSLFLLAILWTIGGIGLAYAHAYWLVLEEAPLLEPADCRRQYVRQRDSALAQPAH